MPELFKLRNGPWTKVFEGKLHKHSVEIYSNQKSMLSVMIYEIEKEKVAGAVVSFYKIFHAKGDTEAFVETLPRETLFFLKHDKKGSTKFFAVASPASYITWEEEEFQQETDRMLLKLEASANMIRDVSQAYSLKLTELGESPKTVKETFFAEPILFDMLSTKKTVSGHKVSWRESEKTTPEEVLLGVLKDGEKVVGEPLSLLLKTIISAGTEGDRMHAMQVLVEGVLLSNVPSIIFDWNKRFGSLGAPKKNISELENSKLDIEPIGFPVKTFAPGVQVQANLKTVNANGLMQLFGAGNSTPAKTIVTALGKGLDSIEEVKQQIAKTIATPELSTYELHKAVRMLSLIEQLYPKLFNGPSNLEEIAKQWVRAIGRASIIDLSYCDKRQGIILVSALVKELLQHYEKQGPTKKTRAVVFVPEVQKIIGSKTSTEQELLQNLKKLGDYGVGYCVSIDNEIDLEKDFTGDAGAQFTIVSKNDVGIRIESRNQYRCLLRPAFAESGGPF